MVRQARSVTSVDRVGCCNGGHSAPFDGDLGLRLVERGYSGCGVQANSAVRTADVVPALRRFTDRDVPARPKGRLMDGRATLSHLFTWRSAVASGDSGLTATQRHVALTLSLHMSEKGDSCFPSMGRLVEETGLGLSTIRDALRRLAESGWLEREVSHRRGRTNRYRARVPDANRQQPAVSETASSQQPNRQHLAAIPPSSGGEDVIEGANVKAPEEKIQLPEQERAVVAALVNSSLISGQPHAARAHRQSVDELLDLMPHREVAANTRRVFERKFAQLPPHFVGLAAEELLAADGVRSRVRYLNGIVDRMIREHGAHSTPVEEQRRWVEDNFEHPDAHAVIDDFDIDDPVERQELHERAEQISETKRKAA